VPFLKKGSRSSGLNRGKHNDSILLSKGLDTTMWSIPENSYAKHYYFNTTIDRRILIRASKFYYAGNSLMSIALSLSLKGENQWEPHAFSKTCLMKKILIAEDHSIVINGLKLIVEKEFTGFVPQIVSSIAEMMKALKNNEYSLAILDMQLEDGVSINIIPDILKLYPSLPILMFTGYPEDVYAKRLFNFGVKGYLNKNSDEKEIVFAVQTVLAGKTYFSEHYKDILLGKNESTYSIKNPFDLLSQREMETALLLLQGKRSSQICSELNIQPSTVTTYKIKIFTKLGVNNVVDLEKLANLYHIV
jgi:DNA-binding NarL/FixJ family response regulator